MIGSGLVSRVRAARPFLNTRRKVTGWDVRETEALVLNEKRNRCIHSHGVTGSLTCGSASLSNLMMGPALFCFWIAPPIKKVRLSYDNITCSIDTLYRWPLCSCFTVIVHLSRTGTMLLLYDILTRDALVTYPTKISNTIHIQRIYPRNNLYAYTLKLHYSHNKQYTRL